MEPEMMIKSACRGVARATSVPKRAKSCREAPAAIISMAQQRVPNVNGHKLFDLAQLMSESSEASIMLPPSCDSTMG
jgi:hypothetical protein